MFIIKYNKYFCAQSTIIDKSYVTCFKVM